jgi:hypothetical protein
VISPKAFNAIGATLAEMGAETDTVFILVALTPGTTLRRVSATAKPAHIGVIVDELLATAEAIQRSAIVPEYEPDPKPGRVLS